MNFKTQNIKTNTPLNLLIILVVFVFLHSCKSGQNASNRNVAGIYMPGINLIDPSFKVFNKNDSLTQFYFRLNAENLLYTKKRSDSTYTANVEVTYQLTEKDQKEIIDSATLKFVDFGKNNQLKYLDGTLELATQPNKEYDLIIMFNDINRDNYLKKRIYINRLNQFNSQNFLPTDTLGNVIFKNYFNIGDVVELKKNETNSNNTIALKIYNIVHGIAKPPFSESDTEKKQDFLPDSIQVLTFDENSKVRLSILSKGLYHFQSSEINKEGPTFYSFQDNFPSVKSIENMIAPMRYISTKDEYNKLLEAENQKVAMDEFWLDIAGSTERARTLIKEYFNRVENANEFFTSYLEGWKTDRGLIYLIYGTPTVVYKHKDYENWIYGEENNVMSLNFVFYKVKNPITNNDYSLSRSSIYKTTWYRAVDTWRSGRIY
ncbi:GWxTD domain-containing protein [Vicingus serpentipes]|uniref:GWxTD domain-containing protein n=1 Tax=Vicingus serpentipes TaxID=1926625 RepID=A0A5C6RTU2_9FLAO|nr:GWxTD domain-containing protein [Vicingus serpentipes]TXB65365.1 GWxTD domain-containing protein [Vicingus serpentipes]